jgi:hypothetical protein
MRYTVCEVTARVFAVNSDECGGGCSNGRLVGRWQDVGIDG